MQNISKKFEFCYEEKNLRVRSDQLKNEINRRAYELEKYKLLKRERAGEA